MSPAAKWALLAVLQTYLAPDEGALSRHARCRVVSTSNLKASQEAGRTNDASDAQLLLRAEMPHCQGLHLRCHCAQLGSSQQKLLLLPQESQRKIPRQR